VTAAVRGCTGHEITRGLAAEGINAVATLREFALTTSGRGGVESGVRLSPHYYNTTQEVDAAIDVVRRLAASGPAPESRR
jgi:selenocysteine lyase/cysteine desulfurase